MPSQADASNDSAWKWLGFVCLGLSIAIVLGTAFRVRAQYHPGGPYDAQHGGMADFHNGAYYPAMAFARGVSPYGQHFCDEFPVARATPAYSPAIIALHVPFTWLPLPAADVVYFIFSLVMLVLSVHLVLGEWQVRHGPFPASTAFGLFSSLLLITLVSRGAHTTLLNGYFTPILVVGVVLALRFADDRPWLAAFGVFLAAGKPTYAIPIGLVMLARGNYKAIFVGTTFSIAGALLAAGYLAWNDSWSGLIDSVRQGQQMHMTDPREFPTNTWTRIDVVAIVSKWMSVNPSELTQLLLMFPLIAIPCLALRLQSKRGDRGGITTLSGTIAVLALLSSIYHHVYDSLILIGPIASLWVCSLKRQQDQDWRTWLALGWISVPWWNYVSSEFVLNRLESAKLHSMITSVNGVVLAVALMAAVRIALRSGIRS